MTPERTTARWLMHLGLARRSKPPHWSEASIQRTCLLTILLMRKQWWRNTPVFPARHEAAYAMSLLVVVVIGVPVTRTVLNAVVQTLVDGLSGASESGAVDAREQLQQVLAAEMSWHHAVLGDLAPTPATMADADRYIAGDIDLDELTRRFQERRKQP